jgi:hypothetical protein
MNKERSLRRKTVDLKPGKPGARPSRIRRDPVPVVGNDRKSLQPVAPEREAWVVVIGVILFALAITVITVGASNYLVN